MLIAEPGQGQLNLYSPMVSVKRFTRLHHPLFYHFMSLSKTFLQQKSDHKCLVSVLLLDTVEQPIIVSDYTSLRRSQFKVKLKRTVFTEKNRRVYVIGKIQKFSCVYRLEIVLINAFFMNVLLAPTPKTKHDELLTLQYFLPSLRKAFLADFLQYTLEKHPQENGEKLRHLPLGFGNKGW